jgi:hypothetical protein
MISSFQAEAEEAGQTTIRGLNCRTPAAILRDPGGPLSVEVRAPGPGEVVVRYRASGICHSDEHARRGQYSSGPRVRDTGELQILAQGAGVILWDHLQNPGRRYRDAAEL